MNKSKCSRETCCTIQYGEDAGVCMLDNCSCHTPKTTDSEDWEEELKELIPGMLGMGGRGFKEYSPLILLIEKVEKAARESGRESVNEIYLTREEAYKKGYESGKNDVVDYLEKNLPKSGNDGRVIHRSTFEQARLLDT